MNKLIAKALLLSTLVALPMCVTSCGDEPFLPNKEEGGSAQTGGESNPEAMGEVAYNLPAKELRAAFIATVSAIDWPASTSSAEVQKKEYTDYLDLFAGCNINAVLMQIRPTADAFFASDIEPWSEWITGTQGKDPGYDVLRFMIDEAHKRGMEFHAWINPYRISNNANTFRTKGVASHPAKQHPEWTFQYGQKLIYRPALPQVQDLICNVIDEIVTKYDVDGIHFDDYFYPYPETGASYDDAQDYATYGTGYNTIEDFRRGNVDKVIERIHNLLAQKAPGVVFSISPFGIWRNGVNGGCGNGLQNYDDLYADVKKWCAEGWVDFVAPQLYNTTANNAMNFTSMCGWWNQNAGKAKLGVSMATYRFGVEAEAKKDPLYNSNAELTKEFSIIRGLSNMCGQFLYNASSLRANRVSLMNSVRTAYADPALIPVMGGTSCDQPKTVTGLKSTGSTLQWDAQQGMRYVVYRVSTTTDPKRCNARVLAVVSEPECPISSVGRYAVSALNADNAESALTQPLEVKSK